MSAILSINKISKPVAPPKKSASNVQDIGGESDRGGKPKAVTHPKQKQTPHEYGGLLGKNIGEVSAIANIQKVGLRNCLLVLSHQQSQEIVRLLNNCCCHRILRRIDVFCDAFEAGQVVWVNLILSCFA